MTKKQVFLDPRARALSDRWGELSTHLATEKKNLVGFLYLTEFLDCSHRTALEFIRGDSYAYDVVGKLQAAIQTSSKVSSFWESVTKELPQIIGDEQDMDFLTKEGGTNGVLEFLFCIGPLTSTDSPVLRRIFGNMHAYK